MKRSKICNRRGLLAPVFLILLMAGCVSADRAPLVLAPEGPAMNMARGLYERGFKSLAARGGAAYQEGDRRNYFTFEVVADKADFLFTALDPAGRPAFRLASDGKTLEGLVYGQKQYFHGPATPENFGRFLPLGLSQEDLKNLLTGASARPASAGVLESGDGFTEIMLEPQGGADDGKLWRLRLLGDLGQDALAAALQRATFGSSRRPEIAVVYANVKNVPREDLGGRPEAFPHSIEARWEGGEKSLRVTYREVRLGLSTEASLFKIAKPQGFETVELD